MVDTSTEENHGFLVILLQDIELYSGGFNVVNFFLKMHFIALLNTEMMQIV